MNRREKQTWLMAQWRRRLLASRGPVAYPLPALPAASSGLTRSVARQQQLRRSAAGVDIRVARCCRWMDTVGLLNGCAPEYLMPLLAYALSTRNEIQVAFSDEDGEPAPANESTRAPRP
jgi:hypothetical protein